MRGAHAANNRAAVELCQAAQLCVYILGMQYLSLGVLGHVFGVRYAYSSLLLQPQIQSFLCVVGPPYPRGGSALGARMFVHICFLLFTSPVVFSGSWLIRIWKI